VKSYATLASCVVSNCVDKDLAYLESEQKVLLSFCPSPNITTTSSIIYTSSASLSPSSTYVTKSSTTVPPYTSTVTYATSSKSATPIYTVPTGTGATTATYRPPNNTMTVIYSGAGKASGETVLGLMVLAAVVVMI
jgi:hypothetical protein